MRLCSLRFTQQPQPSLLAVRPPAASVVSPIFRAAVQTRRGAFFGASFACTDRSPSCSRRLRDRLAAGGTDPRFSGAALRRK
jgi:hypothetical protein